MLRRQVFAAASLLLGYPGRAVGSEHPATDPLWTEARYLPWLDRERRSALSNPLRRQLVSQILAACADEHGAFASFAPSGPAGARRPPPSLEGYGQEDALAAIVQAARGRRVVMLNEAHHISRSRAFASEVAVALGAQGFGVLACETLNNDPATSAIEALNTGAPFTTNIGTYAIDPVFADLLRSARSAGYAFAAYEAKRAQDTGRRGMEAVAEREEAEAVNFIAQVLERYPRARVLVHCGFAHLSKSVEPGRPI